MSDDRAAPADPAAIADAIRARARAEGFDAVGITGSGADPADAANLDTWLAEGRHGEMEWMQETRDRRAAPRDLWPQARSIVSVGMNYGPAGDPLALLDEPDRASISVYARGRDYHDTVKKRLKALARFVAATWAAEVKVFVDTAPVMEKPIAQRAGVGWIGKHTNLVSRRFGSWLFLGEVFTTLDLPPDRPETDHCGSCDACLRACPTQALDQPYRIDARRCLSYLTIEHDGPIAPDLWSAMGNRVYGCDDCLAACPWNKFATASLHLDLMPRSDLSAPRVRDLVALDETGFRSRFAGTGIKRIGHHRFARNLAIAGHNEERAALTRAYRPLTRPSPDARRRD